MIHPWSYNGGYNSGCLGEEGGGIRIKWEGMRGGVGVCTIGNKLEKVWTITPAKITTFLSKNGHAGCIVVQNIY